MIDLYETSFSKILPAPHYCVFMNSEEKKALKDSNQHIKDFSTGLETINREKNRILTKSVAGTLFYRRLSVNPEIKAILENIVVDPGAHLDAHDLIADLENLLVDDFNANRFAVLARSSGVDKKTIKEIQETAALHRLETLSGLEQISRANDVNWYGAFDLYFAYYWSDPEKNVTNWKEDLLKNLEAGTPEKAHAYQILDQILIPTDGNKIFLEDLIDPGRRAEHNNALQVLDAFVADFKKHTNYRLEEIARMGEYKEKIHKKGATVTEKVMSVVERFKEGIFSGDFKKVVMYGGATLLFLAKGLFSKDPRVKKWITLAGGGLLATMIYEDVTDKSILGVGGIETPDENSKGTMLNRMALASGIDRNEVGDWNAHEILHKKNVEDVLNWYDNLHTLGRLTEREARTRAGKWSAEKSMRKSRLLSPRELRKINPNLELAALSFKKAVEAEFMVFGQRATQGGTTNTDKLKKAGRDLLYNTFTKKGVKEQIANGEVPFLAKAVRHKVTGDHKVTWLEAVSAFTLATDIDAAVKDKGGFPWLKGAFAEGMSWLYEKTLKPAWFDMGEWAGEKADELKATFWIEYGEDGWEAMKEFGEEGWNFARDKKNELKVWWKTSETAYRLRRTGKNMWEVTTSAAGYPLKSTLYAADWASSNLRDVMVGLETDRQAWMEDTVPIVYDMFPERGGNVIPIEKVHETRGFLLMNKVADGYKIFGKFEDDFYQVALKKKRGEPARKAIGILANRDFMDNPDSRIHVQAEEGYMNFVGIGPRGNRNAAFNEGLENMVRYFKQKIEDDENVIDQSTAEGRNFYNAIESGNEDDLREYVYKNVCRFGAMNTKKNGYLVFLHIPFPSVSTADTYERTFMDEAGELETRTLVPKYHNRYRDMAKGKHRQEYFDRFKHTLEFSVADDIYWYDYIEHVGKQAYNEDGSRKGPDRRKVDINGHYVRKYMEKFGLWNKREVRTFVGFELHLAEGKTIPKYNNNDTNADAHFG